MSDTMKTKTKLPPTPPQISLPEIAHALLTGLPLTPAQKQALGEEQPAVKHHKLSWVVLLSNKLNRLSFPSLTQGADKLTEGKEVAGFLSIMRHYDQKVEIPANIAARLETAIVERQTQFQKDFRKESKRQDPRRDIYLWMLRNHAQVEACDSKGEIFHLVKQQFPKRHIDWRSFYKMLAAVGLPLSKPVKKRTP